MYGINRRKVKVCVNGIVNNNNIINTVQNSNAHFYTCQNDNFNRDAEKKTFISVLGENRKFGIEEALDGSQ